MKTPPPPPLPLKENLKHSRAVEREGRGGRGGGGGEEEEEEKEGDDDDDGKHNDDEIKTTIKSYKRRKELEGKKEGENPKEDEERESRGIVSTGHKAGQKRERGRKSARSCKQFGAGTLHMQERDGRISAVCNRD